MAGGPEPTSADFSMSYAMEMIEKEKFGNSGPASRAYVTRIQARYEVFPSLGRYELKLN
jgi:hypothetical protein